MSGNTVSDPSAKNEFGKLTLWLDITMHNTTLMQVSKAFKQLQRVYHNNLFIFNTAMFQEACEGATRTELHEDVDLVPMNLNAVVGHDIRVIEDFEDIHLISNLASNRRYEGWIL